MDIFVIIVSYNFEKWLQCCLGSLRESSIPVSVIVVDNCSKDDTVNIIRKDYPEVHLICNSDNKGFGQGNNIGMSYAIEHGADYVFLLNQDAWIEEETIERLLKIYSQKSYSGVLSPIHLNGKGNKLDSGFSVYTNLKDREIDSLREIDKVVEVPFINAAFWMIPVKIVNKVGGFSPLFYHYGEDVDYKNRLLYHGYKIAYLTNAFGYHDREERVGGSDTTPIYLLSEYNNINYSLIKAFAYSVCAGIKKALVVLFKDPAKALFYLNTSWQLLEQTNKVVNARSQMKKKLRHFI